MGRRGTDAYTVLRLGEQRTAGRGGRLRRARTGPQGEWERAPRRVETPLEETCFQAEPGSAICVQRFDDSLNSAIRTTYRISLRSSSLREPRYPSAGVVCFCGLCGRGQDPALLSGRRERGRWCSQDRGTSEGSKRDHHAQNTAVESHLLLLHATRNGRPGSLGGAPRAVSPRGLERDRGRPHPKGTIRFVYTKVRVEETGNDPSAGSPTETLLRLLLPLNDQV